jgi:hypothetical protein
MPDNNIIWFWKNKIIFCLLTFKERYNKQFQISEKLLKISLSSYKSILKIVVWLFIL